MRNFAMRCTGYCLLLFIFACTEAATTSDNQNFPDATGEDVGSFVSADITPRDKPVPFHVLKGPDSGLFDCTNPIVPNVRFASAPLSCVTDLTCEESLVVGHRGAGGEFASIAPENSLAGIRAALWMGLDGVELDVRHTYDEKLVVMHDTTVTRTTNGTGRVDEMTLAEVTKLALKTEHALEGVHYSGDFSCARVPTLVEALELTRDYVFVDLDTKTHRIDLVVAAIVELGMQDQVFISVSDWSRAMEAREIDPSVRVQVRPDKASELDMVLSAFDKAPPEIVEIPSSMVAELAPAIVNVGAAVFTNAFAEDAVARLIDADNADYIKYFNEGAHIVQSEFPGIVLHQLKRIAPNR